MNVGRPRTAVSDEYVDEWKVAAVRIRVLQQVFDRLPDPEPGSPIAECDLQSNDDTYLSDSVREVLNASLDNLQLWANTVVPLVFIDGQPVENPQRPYFTLARAGLESAAQAAWVLAPETTDGRVDRHVRLAVDNLDEMAKAMRQGNGELAEYARERRTRISEAHPCPVKRAPSYVDMIREVGPAVGCAAGDAETLWRIASAAAHGKPWFTRATHTQVVGEQFAPGRSRSLYLADPTRITEVITLAASVAEWSVNRYARLIGANLGSIYGQALAAVAATPARAVQAAQ